MTKYKRLKMTKNGFSPTRMTDVKSKIIVKTHCTVAIKVTCENLKMSDCFTKIRQHIDYCLPTKKISTSKTISLFYKLLNQKLSLKSFCCPDFTVGYYFKIKFQIFAYHQFH